MPLLEENDFLPDLDAVPADIRRRAKLMVLNFPGNPTAAIAPSTFFEKVVAFARENEIVVAHDAPIRKPSSTAIANLLSWNRRRKRSRDRSPFRIQSI
jgi:histidinol-phosphate/aromatic aminotransferase/cobyric acid decarboxylase-like protein